MLYLAGPTRQPTYQIATCWTSTWPALNCRGLLICANAAPRQALPGSRVIYSLILLCLVPHTEFQKHSAGQAKERAFWTGICMRRLALPLLLALSAALGIAGQYLIPLCLSRLSLHCCKGCRLACALSLCNCRGATARKPLQASPNQAAPVANQK